MNDPLLLRRAYAAELYLIRHGDAIPGPDEIIPSGIYDDLPLSKEGREQAQKLAERLRKTHFDAVYSSPLRRCQETAAPLLSHIDLKASIIDDIKEISGDGLVDLPKVQSGDDLEVLTKALQARQMEIIRLVGNSGRWDEISSQESSKDFRQRVITAIDGIAQQHIGERVLVFCHGGVINAYVADVLGLEIDFFFPCANTSITVVRVHPEKRVLYVLNDISHVLG
jgi:2,3-bisphosphoglycerate-dependent phosphoglycerate mutase